MAIGTRPTGDHRLGRLDDGVEDRPGYELEDRYRRDSGRVFLSGVQALARLAPDRLRIDRRHGLHTAAFIAGYQGSPLASFGDEAERAARLVPEFEVVCNRSVNEELAATAVMGSQLAATLDDCRHDGVVGLWYGKAPGLDRAGDAVRHAVFAGTHRHGGVVAIVGDDTQAKSSTLPSSSDAALVDLHMPVLFPGDVQEVIDLGRHAIALSRASGLWVGMKIVAPVADGTGTVEVDLDRVDPSIPTVEIDGRRYEPMPSGRLLTPYTLEIERQFHEVRWDLARRYAVDNRLNRITVRSDADRIGLIAAGQTYHELRHGLALLGLETDEQIAACGIRLLQLLMPIPLDDATVRTFAAGLEEIVVVEEKNPTLEHLIRSALYDMADRPRVVGRTADDGSPLIPGTGPLDADVIARRLRPRLMARFGELIHPEPTPSIASPITSPTTVPIAGPTTATTGSAGDLARTPYFCSGCPHNISTRTDEKTLVGGGIGCHAMVAMMEPSRVGQIVGLTAMGSEGAQWIGMSPFVDRHHLVQNIGDGTFFHSGSLAVRAAVAAGIDITYRLLYNGTVAMTGGQDASGAMDVPTTARWLLLEGVRRVIITSETSYGSIADGVEVWSRERLDEALRVLAETPGVTVLIHDQACAAENRRRRSRQTMPTPSFRVVINERVCEGCGDCGDVSNCLSVQPVSTPYGRKTRIHQSSCNFDMTCLRGDCPAFATVETTPRERPSIPDPGDIEPIPDPVVPSDSLTVRISGIGGTGVVTVSQILGTAAMLDGAEVRGLDQTGLSQKAGPVVSDLRISFGRTPITNHATDGSLDCLIAADLLVAASAEHRRSAAPDRTVVIASTATVPTGAMITAPETPYTPIDELRARLDSVSRSSLNAYVDAEAITTGLFGTAIGANIFLVGVAVQTGALTISPASIERAIELNGVAVDRNRAAFRWGRRWVVDPDDVVRAAGLGGSTVDGWGEETLDELIDRLARDVAAHSSSTVADRYRRIVAEAGEAERLVDPDSDSFTTAVARNLHKLMAYKDEYEVARLLLLEESQYAYRAVGGDRTRVTYHLHPPILRWFGMQRKLRLRRSARPALVVLRSLKGLRGSVLDPFRWGAVRRHEREMIPEYERAIGRLCERLRRDPSPAMLHESTTIAALPDGVRGYEHLKLRRAIAYRAELARRLGEL